MLSLLALVPLLILVPFYEIPLLWKKNQWGELLAFALLWLAGGLYALGVSLDWPLPNPTKIIEQLLLWVLGPNIRQGG